MWHLWIGRLDTLGLTHPPHHFALEVFDVGGWLTRGDLALEAGVEFLAVAERRLIQPGLGVGQAQGQGAGVYFGLQPVRIPHMLVMLRLGLSAWVHLLLCLPLPLPSSSVFFLTVVGP